MRAAQAVLRTLGAVIVVAIPFCVGRNAPAQTGPATGPQNESTAFREEVIAEVAQGSELKTWLMTDRQIAWGEKRDGKQTVKLDGKQRGGLYDEIKHLTFSSHGAHLAFFEKRDSAWIFVLDGQENSQRYKKITSPSFQPKGSSYSYCACVEKKCRSVVDGTETGSEYQDVSYTQYSRDGKRLAFFGKRQKKWIAVVDGKELGAELDDFWPSAWGFRRDSSRFYVAGLIKRNWMYVVDSVPGPGFEVISYISFTNDGRHYAYGGAIAKPGFKKQKTFGSVVLDGQASGSYEAAAWVELGQLSREALSTWLEG